MVRRYELCVCIFSRAAGQTRLEEEGKGEKKEEKVGKKANGRKEDRIETDWFHEEVDAMMGGQRERLYGELLMDDHRGYPIEA